MERIAADKTRSATIRQLAEVELEAIRNSRAVDPGWTRLQAAIRVEELNKPASPQELSPMLDEALQQAKADRRRRVAENRQRRQAEAANRRRSMRSFNLKWAEQIGWSSKYDAAEAAELRPEDWKTFLDFVDECHPFIDEVERLRAEAHPPAA